MLHGLIFSFLMRERKKSKEIYVSDKSLYCREKRIMVKEDSAENNNKREKDKRKQYQREKNCCQY